MLKIYMLDVAKMDKSVLLSKSTLDEYRNITNDHIRNESIARDILFDYMIEKENISSPVVYNEFGKPDFEDKSIHFNVSHSGDMIVIVLCDNEIGVDIQKIKDMDELQLDRICKRIYNDDDCNYFYMDDIVTFYQVWTLKESYLKYLGLGLISNIRDIHVDYLTHKISMLNQKSAFYFSHFYYNFVITIVTDEIDKNLIYKLKDKIIEYKY